MTRNRDSRREARESVGGLRLHGYAAILAAYYLVVSHTIRVDWRAEPSDQRRLWICWHEFLVVALIAFHATSTPRGLCLIGWQNRRGNALRIALSRLRINVIQVSDRRGQRYAEQISDYLLRTGPCLLTPDGPVGPARVAKPGAARISQATDVPLGALSYRVSRYLRLRRWDSIAIPLPFCRITVMDDSGLLSAAMDAASNVE